MVRKGNETMTRPSWPIPKTDAKSVPGCSQGPRIPLAITHLRLPAGAVAGPDQQPFDPRWVASGWTIFNNKGESVRQYESFFDDTHDFRCCSW